MLHGKCLRCFTTAGARRQVSGDPREVYRAQAYAPELVTGVYVRRLRVGQYKVLETGTGTGRWSNMAGHGPTLREYVTGGSEIPPDVRERADRDDTNILWEYRV